MQALHSYSLSTLKGKKKELHKRGFIPYPQEGKEAFLKRVEDFKEQSIPLQCALFGLEINWVPVTFLKRGLHFLEGAATFVSGQGLVQIQLHPRFQKGHFWIYSLEEVLAHEAVHAARGCFNEPEFEEILAYQTAKSRFRQFWGPLFRSSQEMLIAMGSLFFFLFNVDILWMIPFLVLGYFVARLLRLQAIFSRCKKRLGLPTLLYLTDREIRSFSKMSKEEIFSYLKNHEELRGVTAYAIQKGEV